MSGVLRVFTRKREYPLLKEFFDDLNIEYELYKSKDSITLEPFDFGVSYAYTKKITPPLLYLARKGLGLTAPNPMVGALAVCKGAIIGEGYHQKYGREHAEVNAINSVLSTPEFGNSSHSKTRFKL